MLKSKKLLTIVEEDELLPTTPPTTHVDTIAYIPRIRPSCKEEWHENDSNALTIITNCLEHN